MLLGNTYTPLQMTESIAAEVFPEQEVVSVERRRYDIYKNYAIVHNVHINPREAFKWKNFSTFILNKLPSMSSPAN